MVSTDATFTVDDTPGVYHHSAGIVSTKDGLLCTYRSSDQHVASWSNICTARSRDGGRTWLEHCVLSESSFEKDRACWVAPQISKLNDGRITVLADRGVKHSPFDWPTLAQWQMPDHGMSNWLFLSSDSGRTWDEASKVDDVGGEPSYIISLAEEALLYTRTDSKPTTAKKHPSMPWGPNYYRSTAVFSDDGGKTFGRTSTIFDDPLIGDCEVGVAEYAPHRLIAISRVGDSGSALNQPSRVAFSEDAGRTWSKPRFFPIYAHRPCVRRLSGSNKLFVTFRAAGSGTPGTFAWKFDPSENYGYQPNSFLWEEQRCTFQDDGLHLRSDDGNQGAVEFGFYPMEDDDSECEFRAVGAVLDADTHGCNITTGAVLRLEKDRISFADREDVSFALDATRMHEYRIVSAGHRVKVIIDGTLRMDEPTDGIFTRSVQLGNRRGAKPAQAHVPGAPLSTGGGGYHRNRAHSVWKSITVDVKNRRDHSVHWEWHASRGKFPDQFRRDQLLLVERNGSFAAGNSGYSSWTQESDGTIVIADYSVTERALAKPIVRAYRVSSDLLR